MSFDNWTVRYQNAVLMISIIIVIVVNIFFFPLAIAVLDKQGAQSVQMVDSSSSP
jgi:uncharacterized membrane protein